MKRYYGDDFFFEFTLLPIRSVVDAPILYYQKPDNEICSVNRIIVYRNTWLGNSIIILFI